jgi:gluconolactonase
MTRKNLFLLLIALGCGLMAGRCQPTLGGEKKETIGKIVRHDKGFNKLFHADAQLEKIAGGFVWTEGTVWVPKGGYLLFSDIPNNAIMKWQPGSGISKFIQPSGYTGGPWPRPGHINKNDEPGTNGLRLDAEGRLVMCCHGDRVVARINEPLAPNTPPILSAEDVKKKRTVLADKHEGKRFNSPNDLVYHTSGDLYFTDPPYGLAKWADDPAREIDYFGVYRRKKDGSIELLTKEMSRPNGIGLSPDEKTLYVANSDPAQPIWKAFPVEKDGSLGTGRVFYDATEAVKAKKPGLPDGLKVDVHGNVFATGPGGLLVLSPAGKLLGVLDTGVPTANCAFGDDGTVLYVAANHDIGRIRTLTTGLGFEAKDAKKADAKKKKKG